MIDSFIHRWSQLVVQYRWVVLILSALVVGLMLKPSVSLKFDNSNEMWFVEGDQTLADYTQSRDLFGNDQTFVIGIEARSDDATILTKTALTMISEITAFFEEEEFVDKVTSLSGYKYMVSEDDILTTIALVEDVDELNGSPEEEKSLSTIMLKEELILDSLITRDLKHTIIVARIVHKSDTLDHHIELVNKLFQFVEEKKYESQGFQFHYTGTSPINEKIYRDRERDQRLLNPILLVIVLGLLLFLFRTVTGVITPLLIIISTLIIMLGAMGLLEWNLNILNTTLIVIIVAIGLGDSIHIVTDYYHCLHKGETSKEAAVSAINQLFIPCFYTTLTTAIGFMALTTTRLAPIREYGFTAAIGVFIAFLLCVTTLPAILSLVKKREDKARRVAETGPIARLTNQLTPFTYNNRKLISLLCLVLFIGSVVLSMRIVANSSYKALFKSNSQLAKDLDYFDHYYKSTGGFTITLDSGKTGGVKDPIFLKEVTRFQDYLESLELTGKVSSFGNYIRQMNQVMHNDDPAFYIIPKTRELIAQYLLLYENSDPTEDLANLKSFEERYLRLGIPQKYLSSFGTREQIGKIKETLKQAFPSLNATFTGAVIMDGRREIYIINGLVKSFSIAFIAILICFFFLLRSIKYGLLALIPSILPIAIAGGVMAVFDIYLNFSTMIIAAVTFGIAVDDTIHVMVRYSRARQSGLLKKEAVHLAVTESGRAVIFTSVILFFGFGINVFASFAPAIHFGFLSAIIIFFACVADLILLPGVIFLKEE